MGPQSILKEFKDALELLVSLREALRWKFTGSMVQGVITNQDKEHPEDYTAFIAGRQPTKTCHNIFTHMSLIGRLKRKLHIWATKFGWRGSLNQF